MQTQRTQRVWFLSPGLADDGGGVVSKSTYQAYDVLRRDERELANFLYVYSRLWAACSSPDWPPLLLLLLTGSGVGLLLASTVKWNTE